MKRSKPPTRSPLPPRTARPKAVNRARKASEFTRCYHSRARVAFVRSLPCSETFCTEVRQSENAHIVSGGAGRKAGYETIIPLCRTHHQFAHQHGIQSLYESFAFRAPFVVIAMQTESHWHSYSGGDDGE